MEAEDCQARRRAELRESALEGAAAVGLLVGGAVLITAPLWLFVISETLWWAVLAVYFVAGLIWDAT